MRLAILADIHGNLPALEAVLRELERLQPDHVVLDGDLINAVPFSSEVVDRVQGLGWTVVRGNHEFYYLDFGTDRAVADCDDPERWGQLHWLIGRMRPDQAEYLALLPDERTLYLPNTAPLRVAHGVPGKNRIGFYVDQPVEQIVAEIGHVAERTLISAHTHVQIDRIVTLHRDPARDPYLDPHRDDHWNGHEAVHRSWHLVNPGSVGLPLNGDPRAQFAVLESSSNPQGEQSWRATHHRVAYDRRQALAAFTTSGMLAAGGIVSTLFYWELVTAEPELIHFFRWAQSHQQDANRALRRSFAAYLAATGRDHYVRARDPLCVRGAGHGSAVEP